MKRMKTILKWTGLGFAILVVVLLLANAVWVWSSGSRLEARLEAIRQAGDPVTLDDLSADRIPAEKNAATYLRRIRDDLLAAERELDEFYSSDALEQGRVTPEQLKKIESVFASYPNILPQLELAAAADTYRPLFDGPEEVATKKLVSAILPEIQLARSAARFLRTRSYWQLARDDRNGALATSLTLFRLSRRLDGILVIQLMGLACQGMADSIAERVLSGEPITASMHDQLEKEWAAADQQSGERFRTALKAERAFNITEFNQDIPGRNNWFMRSYWNAHEIAHLDAMAQIIALADKPYGEFHAGVQKIEAGVSRAYPLTTLIIPALQGSHEAVTRSLALVRSLRVLNALQRRPDAKAAPKTDLSDLGLPAEATIDPFTGKPLIVKSTPRGWLVYSVGRNLTDDGGAIEDHEDVGVGAASTPAQ